MWTRTYNPFGLFWSSESINRPDLVALEDFNAQRDVDNPYPYWDEEKQGDTIEQIHVASMRKVMNI